MTQLLGIKVTRSGSIARPSSHVVWAGLTEAERASHKDFIRKNVHDEAYDGALTLEDAVTDVLIEAAGLYVLEDGRKVDIVNVRGVTAFGYILVRNKRGVLKPKTLFHCYINGEGFGCSKGLRLKGKARS
ncbi:hypothetical protein F6X40_09715 [Paraburkholderia sp. UCT31]|uniref:hypothetical protein n=1 Tax=Paraburkholderia sp. UCT31 TaxID=2615209 RepID=UPI0016553DD6|nr:hypothetical protein [Paraburkholderia sp. UCT31]MBC8737084.1 hypothetical protein [Paraburkholderia sp. UCT31]